MEEVEVLGVVRHSFERDLDDCSGRENVNHELSPECTASTSGRERINSSNWTSDNGTLASVTISAYM